MPGPTAPTTPLSNPDFGDRRPGRRLRRRGRPHRRLRVRVHPGSGDGGRRLAIACYDRLPGAFAIATQSKLWRNVVRTPLAWGTALELWGTVTYSVLVDGKQVSQSQATKRRGAGRRAVRTGLHTWRVVATDRRGQAVTTASSR